VSIFKRGRIYWFHFWFDGVHVQRSTKQGNLRVAREMEAAHRTQLAKAEVGIVTRKAAPIFLRFCTALSRHDSSTVRCKAGYRRILYEQTDDLT
jgi:hypothetical protein